MVTKTEAIKAFLNQSTHKDLASMYTADMEVQVNVAQGDGERVSGDFKGVKYMAYTDGDQTWKPFRIPRNADTTPEPNDGPMSYDLKSHVEGIGMTGWDWVKRVSRWVAFDFDAITGHSERHKKIVNQDDLTKVREIAQEIPWVTVRHSTSGKGLHLYVMLNPVPTANHTEHAALARAILSQMSGLIGYDFESKVDICGGNMWVWHRKMIGTRGLQLIKSGIVLESPPANWEQHINVTKTRGSKIKYSMTGGEIPEIEQSFEQLTSKVNRIKLDQEHKALISWLNDNATKNWWWDQDNHMLVCHTHDLKSAHTELRMRGIFDTISKGQSEQNCFGFPMRRGAWALRRYSAGTQEHNSWTQDGKGWTRCYLNREPDLRTAAQTFNGVEDPQGGYVFQSLAEVKEACFALGATVNVPAGFDGRMTTVKVHKDNSRLVIEIPHEQHDTNLKDWLLKRGKWIKIFDAQIKQANSDVDSEDYDDVVRHLIAGGQGDAGWVVNAEATWNEEPLTHIKHALSSMNLKPNEINSIIGGSVLRPWKLVVRPFQPEYTGDREWNRYAPQLAFAPSLSEDLYYPTWQSVLNHVGQSLTPYLKYNDWASTNGILTGGDYLKCWITSMFKHPFEPLPYLFIYGEKQATGKSTFHEALALLMSRGYQKADQSLTNKDFNGELEGAVLCVVEETNLHNNKVAYERIKDWTVARDVLIHHKNLTPYQVQNTMHWIQCSNERSALPIFPGDTRITMIHVEKVHEKPIPKLELFHQLQKEAPDFLGALMRIDLPEPIDRLRIPIIHTDDKDTAIYANKTQLEVFLEDVCKEAPGYAIQLGDFYDRFMAFLGPLEKHQWSSRQKVSGAMPARIAKGRMSKDSQWYWANITWKDTEVEERPRLVAIDKKLISEELA